MSIPQQAFTFSSTFSPSWPAGKDENDGLCDECAKLNLEESFANAFALYEGARRGRYIRKTAVYRSDIGPAYLGHFYYVTSLGDRLSRATLCKLCNFLKRMCMDPSKGTYKLLAICTSESYLFEIPKKSKGGRPERRPWGEIEHNVFMALVPEVPLMAKTGVPVRWFENELPKIGSIYRLSRRTPDERVRLALPRVVRPRADIGLGRVWLDCCRRAHKFCAPKKLAGAALPGFRAINCAKTPVLVEDRPWSESYVALSYVWGPPSGDWSKTILDAVEVTKQLGEQYLWVDRLCINQSNLQEKQFLVSKMNAIYEGAEFTIVAAAGDARTGLPGVKTKSRKSQPLVELKGRIRTTSAALANNSATSTTDPYIKLVGITTEEFEETCKDREWLDLHRFGLKSNKVVFESEDMKDLDKEQEIMETYGISHEHLNFFKDLADDHGGSIDEMMPKMKHLAQCKGIPLQELIPSLIGDIATRAGVPAQSIKSIARRSPLPVTCSSKIEKPLPPGETSGTTILISTLEDPRITIRQSEWATRGWTYQEGVLSNRRLVFTEQQIYWECNGMAKHESLDILGLRDPSHTRSADYMLSGIFDGDLHRMPELQYGFKASGVDEVSEQVLKLDRHIRAFTSRNLGYDSDSLNAFLGVAARYSTNSGLYLLLGMPVWAGLFATGKPGLQDTFVLSVSTWTHAAQRVAEDAEMYVVDCPRRPQFPSWTWVGWKGRVDFSATAAAGEEEDDLASWEDAVHVEFFKVMTSSSWASSIDRLWSAEMILQATDGSEATMLVGHAPMASTATDLSKTWLLTIREPRVLRHMFLMHSTNEGEWRRLMGKRVQLHLSVPITEAELTTGHKSGELVTVLVFACTVPFIWNGTARYLILRRADDAGTRWERIGRLAMALEKRELDKSTEEMIAALPVKKFGRDLVLI
ncbi:hypothetical protein MMC28_007171 [Mycoblastus sanguinarius]|nr:hypothetical protein [Mycoblastus sanguinarius]